MKLSYRPYTLNFRRPFKIAHGSRSSTPVVIISLEHEGITAYGEASMPPYLGEDHSSVIAFLEKCRPFLENISEVSDLPSILNEIDSMDKGNTAAKASLDIALHDLLGKIHHTPCWKMLGADKPDAPYTTFTIGIDEPDVILEKVREARAFKTLKIKLDGINDRMMIDTIRGVTDQPLAVDVNQGWKDREHALKMIEWLADKNVLFVEQPLPKENREDARWLFERSPLPVYGDESVQRLKDLEQAKECFHGINIKLMKCTGMHEAMKMIRKAREYEMKVLIGCMSETSCAISAAAQLSPLADHADLDGALLISNDLFEGAEIRNGKIILNKKPGIGVVQKVIGGD